MHVLIITGGYLDFDFAKDFCNTISYDKVFAVDKGLEYVDALALRPDYILGDFDTVDKALLNTYQQQIDAGTLDTVIEYHPVKKDAADTELAVVKAIDNDADSITILGATGSRLDHVLSNIGLLSLTEEKNVECQIVDAYNRIRLLTGSTHCCIKKKEQYGDYLSLIPLTPVVMGLTLTGVMYPLTNKTVYQKNSLTVSNQIIEKEAHIFIEEGELLIIESRDG